MMIPLFFVTRSADINKAQARDHQIKQSFHSKDTRSPHHERQPTAATSVLTNIDNIISVTFANDLEDIVLIMFE
jgi:hypothetical protein